MRKSILDEQAPDFDVRWLNSDIDILATSDWDKIYSSDDEYYENFYRAIEKPPKIKKTHAENVKTFSNEFDRQLDFWINAIDI